MDPSINFFLLLATSANVWFVLKVKERKCFSKGYLFLLHLTVSDFLHDLHAEFFKWISCYYTARSNDPEIQDPHQSSSALLSWDGWLRINQFLGFTICLVSLFAVIWLIVEELLSLAPDSALRTWSQFKADFRFRHGALWLAAMLVSMPLLLMAVSPQSFGLQIFNTDLSFLNQRMGGAVFASDSLPSTSFGISSLIPRPPPGHHLCAAWRQLFQLLSNPLWFPIACLCVLPIVAFFLLKRELPPSIGSLNHEEEEEDLHHHTASYIEKQPEGGEEEEDPLYQRYGSSIEKQTIAREDPLFQRYVGYSASRKMVAALFALYYFIFLYDVLFFGQTLDDLDDFQQNDYTHSIMTEQGDLEVILVFHRWTRPFAAILRNLFVGISWTLEDNSVILHV